MAKPSKLGYANLAVKDMDAMEDYYLNVMGLTLMETGEKGERYFSTGLDHHNIVLTPADESNLIGIGFQLDPNVPLEDVKKEIEEKGIEVELKTDAEPGISQILELQDPEGFLIRLYNEIDTPAPGFKENGIAPNKLGHLALGAVDPEKTVKFYQEVLEFRYTDKIDHRANFITCNRDHHVLNVSSLGKAIGKPNLYHIAFELRDSSHQYRSLDILTKNNIKNLWGPTRHTAGHNIAAYHYDPDGNLVELFIEMDQLIPELGYFDPRPWHEELPLKPRYWDDNAAWGTSFDKTLFDHALKKFEDVSVK